MVQFLYVDVFGGVHLFTNFFSLLVACEYKM